MAPAAWDPSAGQQQRVGERGGNLLDVVGHHHDGRRTRIGRHRTQQRHQLFASAEVESGGRLVEQPERRVAHQRAGQQHALALSRRERAERGARQCPAAEAVQQCARLAPVGGGVAVPPGRQRGVLAGDDDILRAQLRLQHVGQRGAGQLGVAPELAGVGAPEALPEHVDGAARRVQVQARNPQQRRLARPVRPEHRPPFAAPYAPVDAAENRAAFADQVDARQRQHHAAAVRGFRVRRPAGRAHRAPLYRRRCGLPYGTPRPAGRAAAGRMPVWTAPASRPRSSAC